MTESLIVSEEVREALSEKRLVVVLESSLISQGLPAPHNFEIALRSEELLRDRGVIPATVGILDGKASVGLTGAQIERLATQPEIPKVNQSNLAALLAEGE